MSEIAKTALLLVSNVSEVSRFCLKASTLVKEILYINFMINTEGLLPMLSKEIVHVYSNGSKFNSDLDVRLALYPASFINGTKTSFDLILYDNKLSQNINIVKAIHDLGIKSQSLNIEAYDEPSHTYHNEEHVKTYDYVAVGGTFDRLHNGHKILLSQAALRATKHLTVGITDVNMIQSKKLWELIEPTEIRKKAVLEFLRDINPKLEYNVLAIQDLYGPTKDDPKYQLIVVSEETERGAAKINEKRKQNGIPILDTFVISLASDSHPYRSHEEEEKISSSNQRMRLLGTLLRPPVLNPKIPDYPYVIGLAGGIASGKSNIAEKLKAKGAAVINCDIIAHELYKPGLPLNQTIATHFGQDILTENGEVDRRKLGQIVFSNQTELERLNSIVWPAVINETRLRVQELGRQGYSVVVMEAAVMVRAGWYRYCHQLWVVIVPPEEAVKRLMKRNQLSEEEAQQRVASQPTNSEQIAQANVVFSPYWSYEYTQSQIDRAWDTLQQFIKKDK